MVGNYLFLVLNHPMHYNLHWGVWVTVCKCKKVNYAGNIAQMLVIGISLVQKDQTDAVRRTQDALCVYGGGDIFSAKR